MGLLPPPLNSSPWDNVTGIGHGADWGQGHNYHPDTRSFWPLGQTSFESEAAETCSSSTTSESASDYESVGSTTLGSDSNEDSASVSSAMSEDESQSDATSVSDLEAEATCFHPKEIKHEVVNGTTYYIYPQPEAACFYFAGAVQSTSWNGTTYYSYSAPGVMCFYPL